MSKSNSTFENISVTIVAKNNFKLFKQISSKIKTNVPWKLIKLDLSSMEELRSIEFNDFEGLFEKIPKALKSFYSAENYLTDPRLKNSYKTYLCSKARSNVLKKLFYDENDRLLKEYADVFNESNDWEASELEHQKNSTTDEEFSSNLINSSNSSIGKNFMKNNNFDKSAKIFDQRFINTELHLRNHQNYKLIDDEANKINLSLSNPTVSPNLKIGFYSNFNTSSKAQKYFKEMKNKNFKNILNSEKIYEDEGVKTQIDAFDSKLIDNEEINKFNSDSTLQIGFNSTPNFNSPPKKRAQKASKEKWLQMNETFVEQNYASTSSPIKIKSFEIRSSKKADSFINNNSNTNTSAALQLTDVIEIESIPLPSSPPPNNVLLNSQNIEKLLDLLHGN